LMERHGALAMGFGHRAPYDACDKMEMLEGVARVQLLASLRRPPSPLPREERDALEAQRKANLKRLGGPPGSREGDR
jgi:ribulose-5-phosphate 4-epimerase/fuculose-1-phosphate aldolase